MKELIVVAVFVGNLTVTSYRSVPSQTDDSPFFTSIGERVNGSGIAVSQDLLKSGKVHYGDVLFVEGVGWKVVNDCMNVRHKNAIDIWLETREQEVAFQNKWRSGKVRVWKVKPAMPVKK